jgi:hypothetical protein
MQPQPSVPHAFKLSSYLPSSLASAVQIPSAFCCVLALILGGIFMMGPQDAVPDMASSVSSLSSPASPTPLSLTESTSILWLTLSLVYSAIYLLQRIAISTTMFATYTLPAWLFTLFSMSLTFTMNFTTLYVLPIYSPAQHTTSLIYSLPV